MVLTPKQIRDLRGNRQQTEFASLLGVTQPTVSRWERGEATPEGETLIVLMQMRAAGDAGQHSDVIAAHVAVPDRPDLSRDLPVLGTAEAGEDGALNIFAGDVIDRIGRPPGLSGAREAYAIFVVGDSMEPVYRRGDLLFVHPKRPPQIGDDVIVQLKAGADGERRAYLKRLVRRTAATLVLRQFNPDREKSIAVKDVDSIHKVLTNNDMYGV